MLPNSRNTNYLSLNQNHWIPSRSLLNVLEPQKCDSKMQRERTWDASSKQTSSKDSKEEIDLINLMDDIYITKQHTPLVDKGKQITDYQIKALEEFVSTTGKTNTQNAKTYPPEQEKEFQRFFDKCEASASDSATRENQLGKTESCLSRFNFNTNIGTSKKITPMLQKDHDNDENLKVDEDLIEEILMEKSLENRLLRNGRLNFDHGEVNLNRYGEFSNTSQVDKKSLIGNFGNMNDITNNNIIFSVPKSVPKVIDAPLQKDTNTPYAFNLNNHFASNKEQTQKSYQNINTNELVTKHNITYLEAVKKDEKKQSMLKNNFEKLTLTPGPTLEEKAIVLPQIMQRLKERQKVVDSRTNMKQKLVLDSGSYQKPAKENQNMKPTICMKTDPIHGMTLQSFPTSVPHAVTSKAYQIPVTFANVSNYNQMSATKSNVTTAFVNTKTINRRDVIFTPMENLRALRQEQNQAHQGPSSLDPERASPRVLRPPEMIQDNCNKERYIGYATSRLFDDFIHGK